MAKFFAPGRGGDFCKLSVCQKPESTVISVLVLRNHFFIYLFHTIYYLFHTIYHATEMLGFEIQLCLLFQDDTYLINSNQMK